MLFSPEHRSIVALVATKKFTIWKAPNTNNFVLRLHRFDATAIHAKSVLRVGCKNSWKWCTAHSEWMLCLASCHLVEACMDMTWPGGAEKNNSILRRGSCWHFGMTFTKALSLPQEKRRLLSLLKVMKVTLRVAEQLCVVKAARPF